jgi:tyrosine-protein kinase Etk/Wzc
MLFGLGFIIPVLIIFIIVFRDNRIKDAKELEEDLAMPLLAKIPQNKSESSLGCFR